MAVMIRDVLAQPAPERLDGHQIRTVPRQRHQFDVQRAGDLPDGLGPVIGRAVPQHDQLAIGPFGPQPSKNLDRVVAVGAREGPQPHLTFVVEIKPIEGEIKPIEGDACGQTRRAGGDPEPLAALAPAVAEIAILMDVRLIQIDQQMLVALGAVQHALELLDKRLSPLRIGPAEQLLGLLPRQLASTTACFHDSLLPRQLASTTACFHDSLLPRQLASTTACFHDSLLPRQLASTTACFHLLSLPPPLSSPTPPLLPPPLPPQLSFTTALSHHSILPPQLAFPTACYHDSLLPRQLASTTACFHDSLLPRQLASTTACF